jgi:hypothetical protein
LLVKANPPTNGGCSVNPPDSGKSDVTEFTISTIESEWTDNASVSSFAIENSMNGITYFEIAAVSTVKYMLKGFIGIQPAYFRCVAIDNVGGKGYSKPI